MATNPINRLIISPKVVKKRTYSSRYKSNSSISSTTDYKSSLDSDYLSSNLDLVRDSGINYKAPRKK